MLTAARSLAHRVRRSINIAFGRDVPFRPEARCPRQRLGSHYGGWVICPAGLNANSVVYSFGVGEDITFDIAMIDRFGCTVHAFDPTPKAMAFVNSQSLPKGFDFESIGLADFDGTATFALPRSDYVSYRMNETTGADVQECRVERLRTIAERKGHAHIDVLKIDIEGAEYAVIGDILRDGPPIGQFLVEFHHRTGDLDSLEHTRRAIESLRASGYRIFDVSPLGFEYSLIQTDG